jgi:pyruvate/2-oxoglutarate dehydrogenase complex dihydrolipoamide acyltransferase (E2) component
MLDANICVAYAAIDSLSRHRLLNSAWHDDGIIVWQQLNLEWLSPTNEFEVPLIVPNAADLSLQGLARGLHQPLSVAGTTRPTFTISVATAAFWSEQPVTAGHTAILHIGATSLRPHVVEEHGVDTIKLRPLNILTLSYDARIAAQHQADAFLTDIKQRLEHFDALC